MKKNTNNKTTAKKLEVLRHIEDYMGKYLPAKALVEISRMVDYSGYNGNFSIKVENAVARTTTALMYIPALEYRLNYNPENPFILNLDYDMRIYRKSGDRKAYTTTEVLFKGEDGRIYVVSIDLSITLKTPISDYDDLMFSSCYLYAKEILESIDFSGYISKTMKLPENYSCISEESKEFYDGYVVHRNHGRIEHTIKGGTANEA